MQERETPESTQVSETYPLTLTLGYLPSHNLPLLFLCRVFHANLTVIYIKLNILKFMHDFLSCKGSFRRDNRCQPDTHVCFSKHNATASSQLAQYKEWKHGKRRQLAPSKPRLEKNQPTSASSWREQQIFCRLCYRFPVSLCYAMLASSWQIHIWLPNV